MVHLDCVVGLIARVVFQHFLVGIWLFYKKKKLEQEAVTSVQFFCITVTGGDKI